MIVVKDLHYQYGQKPVLKQVSFQAEAGSILGFLGPSGAGKSTLQKILTAQIKGYRGSAQIDGVECREQKQDFFARIGVDFEFSTCYEKFTARENLAYFGSFYQRPRRDAEQLLKAVGLEKDGDKKIGQYSKGMKSRLNFIKALLHDPEILFLDEPTSGLDPLSSRQMKDLIGQERARGKTIILTTHNMEDAAALCDQVAFLVDGRICALDSPRRLVMRKGAETLAFTWQENGREQQGQCRLAEAADDPLFQEVLQAGRLTSVHSTEPTLHDIFAEVTGRRLIEDEEQLCETVLV